MNLICALYFVINISFICAYHIYPVPGVKGLVKSIQYDSKFNIYVTTNSNSSTIFYKINPTKTIVYQAKNLRNIQKILISTSDNIYLFDQYERFKEAIYTFTPDSTTLTKIHEYSLIASVARQTFYCKSVQLLDNADNLYFNTGYGIGMIKVNETIPRAILGLEYFWIDDDSTHAVSNGNVYLGGSNLTTDPLIATITTDQQRYSVPNAYISRPLDSTRIEKVSLTGMKPYPNNGVLIGISGNQARLLNGGVYSFGVLLSQYQHDYINFYSDTYNFYFFSVNLFNGECYLNYARNIQQSWAIVRNPDVFESDICYNALKASDSVGNFFFAYGTQVFTLRSNDTDVEKITFLNEPSYNISSIMFDKNDSLWIVAGDLYEVKKDSAEANQLTHSAVGIQKGLLKMYKHNEILIGTDYGLYVFSN